MKRYSLTRFVKIKRIWMDAVFTSFGKRSNSTQLLRILPPSDTLPNAIDADWWRVAKISLRRVAFNYGWIALFGYAAVFLIYMHCNHVYRPGFPHPYESGKQDASAFTHAYSVKCEFDYHFACGFGAHESFRNHLSYPLLWSPS